MTALTALVFPEDPETRSGDIERFNINTLHGQPYIWLPDDKKLQAMPLVRQQLLWGRKGKRRSILYMIVSIPDSEDVPEPLRGATTLIRVNSTPEEVANDPHTRRTKSLRPIFEQDPHFAEIFGAREDLESTFSNIKYLTRGKLPSTHEDRNRFYIAAYMILRMS